MVLLPYHQAWFNYGLNVLFREKFDCTNVAYVFLNIKYQENT